MGGLIVEGCGGNGRMITADYLRWRPEFAKVLDPARYTIQWLDGRIEDGEAIFACCGDAAIVVEFREYPTGAKDLHGLIAAGRLESIVGVLIPQAEMFGKANGCLAAVIESRPAWMKALVEYGYELHQACIRKVL